MRYHGDRPVDRLDIAPAAPEAVLQAHATFTRLSEEYRQAEADLAEVKELGRVEIAAANQAAAAARISGKKAKSPAKVEAEVEEQVAEAQANLAALNTAVDQAGDTLAAEIVANRDAWLPALDGAEELAKERLNAALVLARQALKELSAARSGPQWLRQFNLRDARGGLQGQYVLSPVLIDTTFARADLTPSTYTDPVRMLDVILEQAVTPPAPPQPRPLKTARESSMGRRI